MTVKKSKGEGSLQHARSLKSLLDRKHKVICGCCVKTATRRVKNRSDKERSNGPQHFPLSFSNDILQNAKGSVCNLLRIAVKRYCRRAFQERCEPRRICAQDIPIDAKDLTATQP